MRHVLIKALIAAFVLGQVPHWDEGHAAAIGAVSLVEMDQGEADGDNHHGGTPDHDTAPDCPVAWCAPSFLTAVTDFKSHAFPLKMFRFQRALREVRTLPLTRDPPVPRFFS